MQTVSATPTLNWPSLFGATTLFIAVIITIFCTYTIFKCLKLIRPENRKLPPWCAWLLLVPFFSYFWSYIVIYMLAKSLHAENQERTMLLKQIDAGRNQSFGFITIMIYMSFFEKSLSMGVIGLVFGIGYWVNLQRQINLLAP